MVQANVILALLVLLQAPLVAQGSPVAPRSAISGGSEEWIARDLPLQRTGLADKFWEKSGLSLRCKTLQVPSWETVAIVSQKPAEAEEQRRLAELMGDFLRVNMEMRLFDQSKVSKDSGDLVLMSRAVEYRGGSQISRQLLGIGFQSERFTYEIKLIDRSTGETLLVLQNSISVSSREDDLRGRLKKWANRFIAHLEAQTSVCPDLFAKIENPKLWAGKPNQSAMEQIRVLKKMSAIDLSSSLEITSKLISVKDDPESTRDLLVAFHKQELAANFGKYKQLLVDGFTIAGPPKTYDYLVAAGEKSADLAAGLHLLRNWNSRVPLSMLEEVATSSRSASKHEFAKAIEKDQRSLAGLNNFMEGLQER
jgi:hypothetical protein